ncbi:hypothetical protein ACNKHR_08505 [Shigella flexneri]
MKTADIERALDAALFTIFSINGERCTAGSPSLFSKASTRNSLNALPTRQPSARGRSEWIPYPGRAIS